MKILIVTGIYPPDIGGPAQYARNLYETWKKAGHEVKVAAYRWEQIFPGWIKHVLFLTKVIRKGWNADMILVLDTFLAAAPTMIACALMHKKYMIRTGGDLLWEWYVERTGEMILLKDFYPIEKRALSLKEKIIHYFTKKSLRSASAIIFSTGWQKGIFEKAYRLDPKKDFIVENYCGPRTSPVEPEDRVFIAGTRTRKWKNVEMLRSAFKSAQARLKEQGLPDMELDTGKAVYDSFVEKIRHSYAVVLASLGDISPNMIFDAISAGTPFILTKETGIYDRVKDCAVFVDPLDKDDIERKIVWLADPANRRLQKQRVERFSFVHKWEDIGKEIEAIGRKTK